jgi:hypothetical protein
VERLFKWLTLAVIVANIALVRTGVLGLGEAVGVGVAIEALLLLLGGRQLIVAVRRYRHDRARGFDAWDALTEGWSLVLPGRLARLLVLEIRLWACLWRWLFRRRDAVAGGFSYHGRSPLGVFLIFLLLTAPPEIALVELLVPWAWLRWALLAGVFYGIAWLAGYAAALVVLPHRLEPGGLRLRLGLQAEVFIPFTAIAVAEQRRCAAPGGRDGCRVVPAPEPGSPATAFLAVGGRTDVTLRLREPRRVRRLPDWTAPVATVHVAVDRPGDLLEALRPHLGTIADRAAGCGVGDATS